MINGPLTEKNLYDCMFDLFENCIISQFKIPGTRYRVDCVIEPLNLAIEFDGIFHYTQTARILTDNLKYKLLSNYNIEIIRIPYFIQLDEAVMNLLFSKFLSNKTLPAFNDFPHGFMSEKIILPADYCYLGFQKFLNDIEVKFRCVKDSILQSLKNRPEFKKDSRLVLPSQSLFDTHLKI